MPQIRFTDRTLAGIPFSQKQTDYWDTALPGFVVRVGTRTKAFQVITGNPRKKTSIGKYPVLSLQEARKRAKQLLADPDTVAMSKLAEDALSEYLSSISVRHKTFIEYERLLKRLNPKGKLREIRTAWLLETFRQYTASEARHMFFAASAFFSWCIQRQFLKRHPLAGIRCPHKHISRDRVLSDQELTAIWCATDPGKTFGRIVRLLILTGQRRSQIAQAEAAWLSADFITFPASIMKGDRPHTVPATDSVKKLFGNFNFSAWSKSKLRLDRAAQVYDWTLHDLRRTFSTIHARIGTPPHVTEAILDHRTGTRSTIQRVYDRHNYLPQMIEAMKAYEAYLTRLIPETS